MCKLHAAHVGGYPDPRKRSPEELLRAWPTLPEVATAVSGSGIRVTVFQAAHTDAIFDRGGVTYRFVNQRRPVRLGQRVSRLLPTTAFAKTVAAVRPDVVHFHGLSMPGCLRSVTTALAPVPVIAQDHGNGVPSWWWRRWAAGSLTSVAAVLFSARDQAKPFVEHGVLPSTTPVFEVLESSTSFSPGDREAARRASGLFGQPAVLWIGRLNPKKDPLTVLEAMRLALHHLPDLHLWCVYHEAPLLSEVRSRLAADRRLREHVHLLGEIPHRDVEQAYRAADVYVSASHREGSGYALLEALACGLTPVVTDIPSFRRITRNGTVGTLFPPEDVTALAKALVATARSDPRRCRREVRRHFDRYLSFAVVGRELRHVYETVVRSR